MINFYKQNKRIPNQRVFVNIFFRHEAYRCDRKLKNYRAGRQVVKVLFNMLVCWT